MKKFLVFPVLAALAAISLGGQAAAQGAARVPDSLVGTWQYGSVSSINYLDTTSNRWISGGGTAEIIYIYRDGSYERTGLLEITTYSCTSKVFVHDKGKVSVSGNRITFTPGAENESQGYSCSPANMYKRQNAVSVKTYSWSISGNTLKLDDTQYRRGDNAAAPTPAPAAAVNPGKGLPAASAPRVISGAVTAPAGQAVSGTAVILCPVDGGCENEDKWRFVKLSGSGRSAEFRFADVLDEPYIVIAWKDVNGNTEVDAGDLMGGYSTNGEDLAQVTAPLAGASIEMEFVK